MDRRWFESSYEGTCGFISSFWKTATDRWLGISSCNWRLCTPWDLAYISCFSRILLHCLMGYHHQGNASRANWCTQSLSSVPCYLHRAWHSTQWILTSKTTLPSSLSRSNSGFWCPPMVYVPPSLNLNTSMLSRIHIDIPTVIRLLAKCFLLTNVLINWKWLM